MLKGRLWADFIGSQDRFIFIFKTIAQLTRLFFRGWGWCKTIRMMKRVIWVVDMNNTSVFGLAPLSLNASVL
jgi:hypothetical protein